MGLKDFLRKSYVAPDFRLHPSSEIGSLPFCQLGQTKCQRTDPFQFFLKQYHINQTNRLPQYKVLCTAFFQESASPLSERFQPYSTENSSPFSLLYHIDYTNRLPQYKVLCTAFFQESAFPLNFKSALTKLYTLSPPITG